MITLTREEAQQVLDTLEQTTLLGVPGLKFEPEFYALIETLRARLSAPEPEPVAWGVDEGEGRCISLHDLYFVKEDADHMAELKGTHAKVVPLYPAPPKREFIGLTDEEITALKRNGERYISSQDFARAIEAKLKEKNNA